MRRGDTEPCQRGEQCLSVLCGESHWLWWRSLRLNQDAGVVPKNVASESNNVAQLNVCRMLTLGLILFSGTSLGLMACRMPTGATEDANASVRIALEGASKTLEGVSDIRRNNRTDTVTRVAGQNLSSVIEEESDYQSLQAVDDYENMASAFLNRHREEFRLFDPASELSVTRVQSDDLGFHQVRFSQRYQDLVVLDAELIVHFDRDGHIYLAQGIYIPTPDYLSRTPNLSEDEAKEQLGAELGDSFVINEGHLVIFPTDDGLSRLAYEFVVRRSAVEGQRIIVDANDGATLRTTPTVFEGR